MCSEGKEKPGIFYKIYFIFINIKFQEYFLRGKGGEDKTQVLMHTGHSILPLSHFFSSNFFLSFCVTSDQSQGLTHALQVLTTDLYPQLAQEYKFNGNPSSKKDLNI